MRIEDHALIGDGPGAALVTLERRSSVWSGRSRFTSSKWMVWAAVESACRSTRAFGHRAALDARPCRATQ
ncbi:hypothetical protein [Burkholderia sp. BCC1977]|uniref:hypothetical protein n=1 Tax=Burkholderia sp. BCC1977 TaxID=2817440 RepID=UPI002ABDE930|nr:hypothetical protein [Burkholderia sp. BCC1977]